MADIDDAKELILWARTNHVVIGSVRVGAVELVLLSMTPSTPAVALPTESQAKDSLYRQYGGDVLEKEVSAHETTVYDDED